MESKILEKIRANKRRLSKIYNLIKKHTDMEARMIDSDTLQILQIISKTDEELTDIIYMILDSKNS